MWHRRLEHHWNRTKSFIHQGYQTLGKWAGHMDRAAGIGKRLFSLALPALQEMGQDELIQSGIQAFVFRFIVGPLPEGDGNFRKTNAVNTK